ncbi:alpha/beta hydrolase [Natronoglycomyces albus]|uniref:Alpha/beta fold hydrolase n=1 Tax=Natronoglycomyces albus TaxID=2811108 RepID=A0A895XS18_9ACTN|nr:alpha/beta fold hydrolase [Natronoglycomyces albus]QSB06313.1 alpha/beta fold hydrolase [Natronoglycomyces albus]
MPVSPEVDAYTFEAGPSAHATVVLCHGFTGSPATLRPWGEFLHQAGFNVLGPRLPGHGTTWEELATTTWQDWYSCLDETVDRAKEYGKPVFAFGHSMGGTLTLRLAQLRGDELAGMVLCNAAIYPSQRYSRVVPLARFLIKATKGIGSDIAMPTDRKETSYDYTPLRAVYSLQQLWKITRKALPEVTVPTRVFYSAVDNVVHPRNSAIILAGISSKDKSRTLLPRSFHVAPLDYDAEKLFTGSVEFMERQLAKKTQGAA